MSSKESSIYQTDIKCRKHIDGLWHYTGKVFYRKDSTTTVIKFKGGSFEEIIASMKTYMKTIK